MASFIENGLPKKVFLFFSVFLIVFGLLFFVVRPFSTGFIVGSGSLIFAAPAPELLWLHFDDLPADGVLDSSVGSHGGLCTSCPTYMPTGGFDGRGAYQFVAGQGITIADEPVFDLERSSPFSISAWVSRPASGRYQAIVAKGILGSAYRGFSFSMDGGTGTQLQLSLISDFTSTPKNQLVVTGSTAITDGAWHHVAVTYDGSSTAAGVKLFVNGVQETTTSTGTLSGTILSDFPLQVGTSQDNDYWVGSLDEIGIYNRTLSLSEVQALALATPPPQPVCGNGVIEGTEQCDGANLNNQTCITQGFTGGTLTCTATCTFNTSQCTSPAPDTQAPTVPTGLTATAISFSQINLSWSLSTDPPTGGPAAGYKIFRGGTQIGTGTTNSYSDSGLSPATTYSYTVSAYDAVPNNSAQSNSASAATLTAPPQGNMTTASTVNCVSPCSVFFDAAAPSSGVVQPTQSLNSVPIYTNLDYTWDFGDAASGNWAWGQSTIDPTYNSRNKASGFEAAHVFELPDADSDGAPDVPSKTFTVSLQVKQNGVTTSYTQNILARAPNHIYYANAATGNDSNPGNLAQPFKTINKGIAMLGSDDKLVLARGQAFSVSPVPDNSTLGAYGSCTLSGGSPVCTNAPTLTGTLMAGSTGVKLVDLHFIPNADYFLVAGSQGITDFLLLRDQIDNSGIYSGYQLDGFFVADSQTTNSPQFTLLTGYQSAFAFPSRKVALLGNHFDHSIQQMLYIGVFDRGVVSHNWLYRRSLPYGDPGSWGKPLFRLGANQANTYKVVIADNVIDNSDNYEALQLAPSSDAANNKQAQNVLVERNELTGANGQHGVILVSLVHDRLITTIRKNILHYSPATTDAAFALDSGYGAPNGVWFHNNTVYTGGFGWFRNDPAAQNVYVYNNTVDGTCVTVTTALPAGATAGCNGVPPTNPALTVSAGPDVTIVSGSSAVLQGVASGGTAPYTYTWSPATGLSAANIVQPTASPSQTTTYTLTVRDSLNATASDNIVVTVVPMPSGGLIGEWKLDNGSGSLATDTSGQGNNGTVSGATWQSSGCVSNACLNFAVGGNNVTIANESAFDFDRTSAFSISGWIKRSTIGIYKAIAAKGIAKGAAGSSYRGYLFGLDGSVGNKISLALFSDDSNANRLIVSGSTVVTDGTWRHVAVTYDGSGQASGVKLYVGGALEPMAVNYNALTGTILTNFPLQLGTSQDRDDWVGSLDEVKLYNSVLTATQVAALANVAPSCVENWSCTAWSACTNGSQTRMCTDSNNCGTTNSKPATTQPCTSPQCSVAADCAAQTCKTAACISGQCAYSNNTNGSTCSDSRFCNGLETCQSGACAAGTPIVCAPDSIACTLETCSDALGSCVSTPNSSLCNDSISCTVDSCDVVRGCVAVTDNLQCNDGIACTVDTCNRTTGCVNDSSACVTCTLTGVSWSAGSVANGQPVTITATATNCFIGETVDLELWESDGSNGSTKVTSVTLPSITLNNGSGSITWNAVWTKDTGDPAGLPGNPYDPEYFVKAILHSNTTMIAVTPNNLTVTNADMDNDGVPNNTDCNDFNTSIGQCSGCSVCSDPLGYNGACTANNSACSTITCTPECDYGTCTGTQIPVFNSGTESGICSVNGNSGTCTQTTCQNYTCQTSSTCNPNLDSDGDGVPDDRDKCPRTLPGTRVNARGCPLPKSSKFTSASTTDFYNADLSNITDLTLGIDMIGNFFFNGTTNLTTNQSASQPQTPIDLDTYVILETNKAGINTTYLPMLNKPAEIKLFNLSFTHPIIQFNGATCTDCQIKSYSNGTLDFTVNHFSDYNAAEAYCGDQWCTTEIGETCSSCAADCGTCPPPAACEDGTCNGTETCTTCATDCGQCPANNTIASSGTNSGNYCPNPQGLRPCPAATWKNSPICEWDTTKCDASELNKECSPGEKRCFTDYLQECKTASPAQWNNLQQCPLGCNPDTLSCNTTTQCTENWQCSNWSQCTNGIQSRLCKDQNQCQTYLNQPKETQKCAINPTCGNNTCDKGENTTCPTDCKNIQLTGIPTEQLALIALALLIFAGLAVAITHVLSARQRV